MAFMTPGISNGQDGARQAAQQYIRPGAIPGPVGGGPAPQSSVGTMLADAWRQTLATISAARSSQEKVAALGPWIQHYELMKSQMAQVQQGAGPTMGQPGPMGAAPSPQFNGAQAMAPMIGRPPR